MPRIKNRSAVPSIPIDWKNPKGVVRWFTAKEPFDTWVRHVWEFCDSNGLERPSAESLDELACAQFPKYVCTARQGYHAPAMRGTTGGCSSCGGKRA